MDVFRVRDRLIEDYREFTGSFVDIHDKTIREHVAERMARGYQWPDPWLSLNPFFASGGTITDLVAEGLLHPECESIFRLKDDGHAGEVLRLHRHQREAIEAARAGHNYVLTTGTGSGKSLAYIVPIVDQVLAAKAAGTPARDQGDRRLPDERPGQQPARGAAEVPDDRLPRTATPVTLRAATPARSSRRGPRSRIIANPPDILLTNYVMLELILTRPDERRPDQGGQGPPVPRARRAAHLPGPAGRGRRAARPPASRRLRRDRRAVHRHVGHDGRPRATTRRAASRGRRRRDHAVRRARRARATSSARRCAAPPIRAAIADQALRRAHRRDPDAARATTTAFVADPLARWIERRFGLEPDVGRPASSPAPPPPADAPGGSRRARRADRRRPGRVRARRSRTRCRPARGSATRRPAVRCSPSGCTSSCPRATPSTSPWSPTAYRHVTSTYQVVRAGRPRASVLLPLRVLPRVRPGVPRRAAERRRGRATVRRPAATPTPAAGTKRPATSTSAIDQPVAGRRWSRRCSTPGCPTSWLDRRPRGRADRRSHAGEVPARAGATST